MKIWSKTHLRFTDEKIYRCRVSIPEALGYWNRYVHEEIEPTLGRIRAIYCGIEVRANKNKHNSAWTSLPRLWFKGDLYNYLQECVCLFVSSTSKNWNVTDITLSQQAWDVRMFGPNEEDNPMIFTAYSMRNEQWWDVSPSPHEVACFYTNTGGYCTPIRSARWCSRMLYHFVAEVPVESC